MTKLQKRILKVYRVFKKFCDQNSLRYYAEGGTKIGASYWKGFIPWDDDMDVVMPLDDYEKLIRLAKEGKLPRNIALLNGLESVTSDIVFSKFHDTSTTFVNNMHLPYPENWTGVFVDIFPMIGLPKGHDERLAFVDELTRTVCKISRGKSLGEFDKGELGKATEKLRRMMREFEYGESEFVAPVHPSSNKEIFERHDFDRAVSVKFQDSEIWRPRHAKEQIDAQYPGFEKMPKNVDRTGHGGLIDLNKSVMEYVEKLSEESLLLECFWLMNKGTRRLKDKNAELRQDPFFVNPRAE
jgi:LPS biosynthesis protein